MIDVSNSFKKAIKSANREIHGYIDIKYQNESYSRTVTKIPTPLNIVRSTGSGIINYSKIMPKYATLEDNYTLLDGSFIVWNENITDGLSYISDNVFEDIENNTIIITNNSTSTSSKGITIYFKENLPFDFTITITDTNDKTIVENVTNNQSYTYQFIFPNEIYISKVEINITSIEFPKNRLRIAYVDFNLGDLYQDDELISFEVDEQLDLLGETVPINTCDINLNNYPNNVGGNKFDPINPKGLTKYLTNEVKLEPYIGVLTEDNGIEYVKMGTFYLDDWSSNSDGNTTLHGSSFISKLKNMAIPDDGGFFDLTTPEQLSSYLNQRTNYAFYLMNGYYAFNNVKLEVNDLLEYLKLLIPFNSIYPSGSSYTFRKFLVNRYDILRLDELNTNIVDYISRDLLQEDVDYETKNKINELRIRYQSISSYGSTQRERIINNTHTLFNTEEYVWYKIDGKRIWDENPSFSYNVISGSGTASLVDKNHYFMVVKYTGTIGSKISVSYTNRTQNETKSIKESIIKLNDNTNGDNFDIDISNFGYAYDEYLQLIQEYYKNMDKNYIIKAKTMGDPSLVIGDTISIQTRYTDINNGYKDMIITKQKFTFDGGLSCEIEGVGD